jgi:hypothetical protein
VAEQAPLAGVGFGVGAVVGAGVGHAAGLQAAVLESAPHEPPCAAGVVVVRVRVFVPLPHDMVQAP